MKYFMFVLLIACTRIANAQEVAHVDARLSPVYIPYTSFQKGQALPGRLQGTIPGQRMRNTGRTLTVLGAVLLIGGIAVTSNAESTYYTTTTSNNGTYEEGDPKGALGVLMIAGGAGMMVPGIIFWSKGSKKYKASMEQEPVARVSVGSNGLSMRYTF